MKLVPKYQEGRDVIRDYRPVIPLKSIKRLYTPTQSYVSQDTKSKWQHEQDSKMADRAYKQQMEDRKMQEGLHNLNGFLTFTDYAGLATGVGGLIGKGVKQLVKRGAKKMIRNRFANGSLGSSKPFNVTGDDELRKMLPDYAQPNWQGDGLALTKQRLKDGGFDRLEDANNKILDINLSDSDKARRLKLKKWGIDKINARENSFSESSRKHILESEPRYGSSKDFNEDPKALGTTNREEDYYTSLFNDAPKQYQTPRTKNAVETHEFSHYTFLPNARPPVSTYDLTDAPIDGYIKDYIIGDKGAHTLGAELTARGTQVKNYFGLKEGQPITPEMLEYATKNYVKDTGYNNNMTDFFTGIKDYPNMAKWLSKASPVGLLPVINNKTNYK